MKVSDALLEGATRWRDTGWVVVEHLDACVGHAVRGVRALTSGFAAPHPHERNHSAVAQQTTTTLVDDLDDTLAANETVAFGLDGTDYEIDLNAEHATALREDLAPRRQPPRRTPRASALGRPGRAWMRPYPVAPTSPNRSMSAEAARSTWNVTAPVARPSSCCRGSGTPATSGRPPRRIRRPSPPGSPPSRGSAATTVPGRTCPPSSRTAAESK